MKDTSYWYLENVDFNSLFCQKKVANVAEHTNHLITFKKNEFIYLPENRPDKMYFIVEGRVKIGTYNAQGKELTKSILEKGEVFGELSMIDEVRPRNFAMALEVTSICEMGKDDMKMMMKDHSSISLFLMKIMGSRVLEMEKRLESMVFKDSRSRIIEYICDLIEKKGERVGYEWVIRNFLTHNEIANITATSRQTVTTVLNDLKSKEILTFNRKRLLVRDLDTLKGEIK